MLANTGSETIHAEAASARGQPRRPGDHAGAGLGARARPGASECGVLLGHSHHRARWPQGGASLRPRETAPAPAAVAAPLQPSCAGLALARAIASSAAALPLARSRAQAVAARTPCPAFQAWSCQAVAACPLAPWSPCSPQPFSARQVRAPTRPLRSPSPPRLITTCGVPRLGRNACRPASLSVLGVARHEDLSGNSAGSRWATCRASHRSRRSR
jgi:hypothetical protein